MLTGSGSAGPRLVSTSDGRGRGDSRDGTSWFGRSRDGTETQSSARSERAKSSSVTPSPETYHKTRCLSRGSSLTAGGCRELSLCSAINLLEHPDDASTRLRCPPGSERPSSNVRWRVGKWPRAAAGRPCGLYPKVCKCFERLQRRLRLGQFRMQRRISFGARMIAPLRCE